MTASRYYVQRRIASWHPIARVMVALKVTDKTSLVANVHQQTGEQIETASRVFHKWKAPVMYDTFAEAAKVRDAVIEAHVRLSPAVDEAHDAHQAALKARQDATDAILWPVQQ